MNQQQKLPAPETTAGTTVFCVPWLRSAKNALRREGDRWILNEPLTTEQRTGLTNLVESLNSRLCVRPTDERARTVEVAKLLSGFPVGRDGEMATELAMQQYLEAVEDVPAWAVSEARMAIVKGQFGEMKWAPTPAQFASAARARMHQAESDLSDLKRIVGADVDETVNRTPEELARHDALMAETRTAMTPKAVARNPQADFIALCKLRDVDPETVPDRPMGKTWGRAA